MANFVVIIDSHFERREYFAKKVKASIAPVDGLVINECSIGNYYSVWASEASAPVSQHVDDEGAAVLWGDAICKNGSDKMDAAQLRNLWNDSTYLSKAVFDGFYAGVVYRRSSGLIAGADILGVFPVYYYASKDILIMGSSPELFSYHPAFQKEFNPTGLVGILLISHMFDGETLWKGVRRLSAGHLLLWRSGMMPVESEQYKLQVSTKYFSLPLSAHVDILDQAINQSITRHTPTGRDYSILLSGGLDSRMLAGYMKERDINIEALTLGLPTDQEMQCAIPVAHALEFRHRSALVKFERYPLYANQQVKWEHISNGFNNIMNWGVYPHLRKSAPQIIMGHMLDAVVGGNHISWAYRPTNHTMSFQNFFDRVNEWGIRPDILKKLLRREIFGDLVDETIHKIKILYESYSELESQRAWCFDLYNRQRFHVGSSAWPLSFGA